MKVVNSTKKSSTYTSVSFIIEFLWSVPIVLSINLRFQIYIPRLECHKQPTIIIIERDTKTFFTPLNIEYTKWRQYGGDAKLPTIRVKERDEYILHKKYPAEGLNKHFGSFSKFFQIF